ncbi:hypothetical protein O181_014380 [Austropuccinia psidii MF-1]|uniref:Uncharacterized protein n=1 Tax=Austropuccinia psidii MF-1 TaxID=1389203 RepID=A0A9Q3C0U9_9BASI|nr:hypothetical protein [Austropuccinia psidii MF-1]
MGPLGPFWPNSNEAKRGQGGSPSAPKPQVGPPEPVFAPKWPKTTSGPPVGHYSAHGLWQSPEATRSAPSKDSSQFQGKNFPFSIHPVLKHPGVVHIWYNIPLCTIFAQQSNGDIFRTQLHDFKSSTQSITNFKKRIFQLFQFGNSLVATRRPFKDHNHLALKGLGCHFLISTILRAILRGYKSFQSLSRHQVLSIPWTTQLVDTGSNQASFMALSQFIFHCGNSVTQFNFQDFQNCIGPIKTIQPDDSSSRISLSAFHIY